MAQTFLGMALEAMATARSIGAKDALNRLSENNNTLLVDVRDEKEFLQSGLGQRAYNAPGRSLAWLADNDPANEWRDSLFENRDREIITTCGMSPCYRGAKAANLLVKMGFTNVAYVEGGMKALLDAEQTGSE